MQLLPYSRKNALLRPLFNFASNFELKVRLDGRRHSRRHRFVQKLWLYLVVIILMQICFILMYSMENFRMLADSQQSLVTQILNDSSYVEPNADVIVLKDTKGHAILNKSIKTLWEQPLRIWDYRNEMLTHIHIVKTSGTSFDYSLLKSLHKDGCGITCPVPNKFKIFIQQLGNRICPTMLNSYCCNHF